VLTHFDIDQLRGLAARGQTPPSNFQFPGIELGAALELAAAATLDRDPTICSLVDNWSHRDERLDGARRAFAGISSNAELWSAPAMEFSALRNASELIAMQGRFFDRFTRSLKAHGFDHLAVGIAKSLFDMADNVIQHSGNDTAQAAIAAVGYEVGDRRCSFAVADNGRGVLASLVTSPEWSKLTSAADALDAAVRRGASRRTGQGPGQGFTELHRALADLSGTLRFATGEAVLKLEGDDPHQRVAVTGNRPALGGFQLSMSLSLQ
jgi:hypothetical protein